MEVLHDANDWLEEEEDLSVDYKSLQVKHNISGYREGIAAGQECMLQDAFNTGFKNAVSYFQKLSKYRGCMSALLMFLLSKEDCPRGVIERIEGLIANLEELETKSEHINDLLKLKKKTETSDLKFQLETRKSEVTNVDMNELVEEMSSTSTNTIDGVDIHHPDVDNAHSKDNPVNQSDCLNDCDNQSKSSSGSKLGCCKNKTCNQQDNFIPNSLLETVTPYFQKCIATMEQQIRTLLDEIQIYIDENIQSNIISVLTQP